MKKTVEFVSEAQDEYLAALTWYWERSPAAATRFEAEIEAAIQMVQQAPARWARYMGCRRFLLHRFPFAIIYEEADKVDTRSRCRALSSKTRLLEEPPLSYLLTNFSRVPDSSRTPTAR